MQFKHFLSQILLLSKLIASQQTQHRSRKALVQATYLCTNIQTAYKKHFFSYYGSSNRVKPSAFRFFFPRSQYFLLHCEEYEKVKCLFKYSWSVGQSATLLLVIPGFSLLDIHDQDFCSLLDMYVFRNGASSSMREGSIFLCGRYVCCTVVSARVHPRCHGVQVTMDSVHPFSLHYAK
jgi:hypothetical protein